MPELPEVETTVQQLRQVLPGRVIKGLVQVEWPKMFKTHQPQDLNRLIKGEQVLDVSRRAKFIILGLTNNKYVVFHRMMSGNLFFRDLSSPPDKYTRFVITFNDDTCLRFVDLRKFGRVFFFLKESNLATFFSKLGPEPLLSNFTFDSFSQILNTRNGILKSFLLNQQFIVGLGNIYANEVLFKSQLHPNRKVNSLDETERERLYTAIRQILEVAIENKGTTLSSYMDGGGQKGRNTELLNVHLRNNQECKICNSIITKILINQRSTYFCPTCQPMIN